MGIIGIVDYGVGNLRSVAGAVEKTGFNPIVSSDPKVLVKADKLILPGVGAFKDGMKAIVESGLEEFLNEAVQVNKTPILGICLGAQLFTKGSEEFGWTDGLGWIDSTVKSLRSYDSQERVPHVGWNNIRSSTESTLFREVPEEALFYFVHSFCIVQSAWAHQTASCEYGFEFVAALEKNNIFAVQFHPEKSQRYGLLVLRNFLEFR
jgi:glutamine amidotransferase